MGKTLKVIISMILILALVGVISLYAYIDLSSKANHVQKSNSELINTKDEIQTQIDALYFDDQKDFLSETLNLEMMKPIQEEINKLNESTSVKNQFLDQLKDIELRYEAQIAVNDFFQGTEEAIRGNQVNEELMIREDLTKETVLEVKDKYYFIEKMDEENEVPIELDNFEKSVNRLIDRVEGSMDEVEELNTLFKAVEKIEIVDGNIGKIAQAMHKFDQRLLQVQNSLPSLYKKMDKRADNYTAKMIQKVAEIAKNVPQYYQLVITSVEPSKRLTDALEENRDLFEVVEASTIESVEVSQTIPQDTQTSSNDYYYEEPENSWTNPDPNPPTTNTQESPGPVEPEPNEPEATADYYNNSDY
ncbi:hypothetical protein [Facklamia miroungae]|uniref:Uncharacterized protein n=1 Tax=Facklamia miroungae TaxID=120956 RepID=A0A1G7RQN2_9LACT|nr:hypothetical protein [Facklamia miroungae]NKZ29316.1 hypothetical protein [Facklamia miroungae]SDG13051.1 hypothetical protein SAMN05421791_103138 [Facklamia miroungae]